MMTFCTPLEPLAEILARGNRHSNPLADHPAMLLHFINRLYVRFPFKSLLYHRLLYQSCHSTWHRFSCDATEFRSPKRHLVNPLSLGATAHILLLALRHS